MEIKFVKRSVVKSSKKRSSKFKPLLEAIEKLKPGGQAVDGSYLRRFMDLEYFYKAFSPTSFIFIDSYCR